MNLFFYILVIPQVCLLVLFALWTVCGGNSLACLLGWHRDIYHYSSSGTHDIVSNQLTLHWYERQCLCGKTYRDEPGSKKFKERVKKMQHYYDTDEDWCRERAGQLLNGGYEIDLATGEPVTDTTVYDRSRED